MKFTVEHLIRAMELAGFQNARASVTQSGPVVQAAYQKMVEVLTDMSIEVTAPTKPYGPSDEAVRRWCIEVPELVALKVYKQLHAMGLRMATIDHEIRKREKKP